MSAMMELASESDESASDGTVNSIVPHLMTSPTAVRSVVAKDTGELWYSASENVELVSYIVVDSGVGALEMTTFWDGMASHPMSSSRDVAHGFFFLSSA